MSKTRTREFRPDERRVAPLRTDIETLEQPLLADEAVSGPLVVRLIPVAVVVLMVVMIGMMIAMGRRSMNPMMFMMPLTLVLGMLGMSMHGGGSGGNSMKEVNIDRKNWLIKLRELRATVQDQGRRIHTLMVANHPNPATLLSINRYWGMWQVRRSKAYTELLPKSGLTDHPFMSARIGVGMIPLVPSIQHERPQVPDNLEPVTAGQFGRFLRSQRVITNCPVAIRLGEERAYVLKGDVDGRYSASRAMLTSLAYNHSPNELVLGIIANPDDEQAVARWNWMKWLPHTQNVFVQNDLPTTRLAWSSLNAFAEAMAEDIAARNSQGTDYSGPNMLIFVDLPDSELRWPSAMFNGVHGVSFVVANSGNQYLAKYEEERANMIRIDENGEVSLPGRPNIAQIDRVSVGQAENFAREMASCRPQGFGNQSTLPAAAAVSEEDDEDIPAWFDVLNIHDIDTYDPRTVWRANAYTESFNVPLGYRNKGTAKTRDLVYLDMVEASRFGTGPHGCVQGKTGTGKSYLLNGLVLTLCTLYGPDKVCFILADFKAGAAFDGYENLPHVIQVLTNLEEQKELVDRAGDVLEGEIIRRQRFLFNAEAKDILEYRQMRRNNPELPPLPDLFFVADEFHELMAKERHYLRLFTRIGAVGRSLGMHVIPCSQFIDSGLLADLMNHLTFGISLTASSAGYSRTVLDGDPGAASLPSGSGHAMLRSIDKVTQENKIERFQGFSIEDKYVSKVRSAEVRTQQRRALEDAALPFGLFASSAELRTEAAEDRKPAVAVETVVHDIGQKWALIQHLNKFQDVQAPDLWQPSLTIPMTLGNVPLESHAEVAKLSGLPIRIGDIDNPLQHSRPPWIVQADANILVTGRSKAGKTMAVASLIANAALTYRERTQWYLVDYASGGLEAMESYPNVGGYATKMDEDTIARYVGEFYNVLDYREKEMASKRLSRVEDYLEAKRANPDPRDPYEHMFLVLDGFRLMLMEDEGWKTSINRLLAAGGRVGLHVVVTATDVMDLHFKQQGAFGAIIPLACDDTTRLGALTSEVKQSIKRIPNQPGRGVDVKTGLSTLVMVPKPEIIEPIIEAKRGVQAMYAYDADHSADIRAFGVELSKRLPKAPRISVIGDAVEYHRIWEIFASVPGVADKSAPLKDRWLPLGIDTRTLTPVLVPKASPHFIIAGDPGSGKTSALRTVITSVVNQYTNQEARFILFDPAYGLLNEMESLCETGYMNSSNYVTSRDESGEVVDNIGKLLHSRQPSREVSKNPRSIIERSWYEGPEVFVIIDNYVRMGSSPGNPAPLDTLVPLLSQTTDVGVHLIMTTPANGASGLYSSNKMFKMMDGQTAGMLMLSGPTTEGRISTLKAKFEDRRPGRGELLLPADSRSQVVQIAWSPPWSRD